MKQEPVPVVPGGSWQGRAKVNDVGSQMYYENHR